MMKVVSRQKKMPIVSEKPTVKTGSRLVYIRLPKPIMVVTAESTMARPVVERARIIRSRASAPRSSVNLLVRWSP